MPQQFHNHAHNLLESLSTQFTWRKLFFIFVSLFFAIGLLMIYENYTGHFKLIKIDNSLDILNKLIDLSKKEPAIDKNLISSISVSITNEFSNFVKNTQNPFDLPGWLIKAYAAFFPWMLGCLIVMPGRTAMTENSITWMMIFSIPYTVIGALLPTFSYSIINYFIYPFGAYLLNTMALGVIRKRKQRKL